MPGCAPQGMLAQLDRIGSLATLPSVTLGLLPWAEDLPVPPLHAFQMWDEALVTVETFSGEQQLRDSEEIAMYMRIFELLTPQPGTATKRERCWPASRQTFAPDLPTRRGMVPQ